MTFFKRMRNFSEVIFSTFKVLPDVIIATKETGKWGDKAKNPSVLLSLKNSLRTRELSLIPFG